MNELRSWWLKRRVKRVVGDLKVVRSRYDLNDLQDRAIAKRSPEFVELRDELKNTLATLKQIDSEYPAGEK